MKRIFIITLVLWAVIQLQGCESFLETDIPQTSEEQITKEPRHLDLKIGLGEADDARSVLSNDFIEGGCNLVRSAILCLVDPESGDIIRDLSTGNNLVKTTASPYFEWSMNIDPDIMDADVYVIANLDPDQMESVERVFLSIESTHDDLNDLFFRCPNSSYMRTLETMGYGLPLAGMTNIDLVDTPERLDLTVKNLFAKYTVWFNLSDLGDISRIENIYARVINANSEIPFFSSGYRQTKESKLLSLDCASENELTEAAIGGRDNAMTFLVPENCQGLRTGARHWTSVYEDLYMNPVSGTKWDRLPLCTYILFKIKCFDKDGNMSIRDYRLYLGEGDMKSDFNVRRNISRTVRLTINPDDVSPAFSTTNGPYTAGPGDYVDISYESVIGEPYLEMSVQGKYGVDAGMVSDSDETMNFIRVKTGRDLVEGDKILVYFLTGDMDGDLIGTTTIDIVEDYGFNFSPGSFPNNDIYGFQEIELVSARSFTENEISVITSRYKWETEWSEGDLTYIQKSPGRYYPTARFRTNERIGQDFTLTVKGKVTEKILARYEGEIKVPVLATWGDNGNDGGRPYYLIDLTGQRSSMVNAMITDEDGIPLSVYGSSVFGNYVTAECSSLDGTDISFDEQSSDYYQGSFSLTCYGFGGLPGLVPSQTDYSFKGKSFPITLKLKSPGGQVLDERTVLARVNDPFKGYGGNSTGIHRVRKLSGEIGYDDELDPKQARNDIPNSESLVFNLGSEGMPWPSEAAAAPSIKKKSGYFGEDCSFISLDRTNNTVAIERNLDCYGRISLEGTLYNVHSDESITLSHAFIDINRVFTVFAGFDAQENYARMTDGQYQRIESFGLNDISGQNKRGSLEPYIVHNLDKGHMQILLQNIGVNCTSDTPVTPSVQFVQDVILTQTGYNGTIYPKMKHSYYGITGNSYKIFYINPTFDDGWNGRPEAHMINFRVIAGFNPPKYVFTPPEHEYVPFGNTTREIRYAGISGEGLTKRYLFWCEPYGTRDETIPHTSVRLFWEGREGKTSFTRHDRNRTEGMVLANGWYDPRYRARYRDAETASGHYWGGMYDYGKNYFELDDKIWFQEDPLFEHRERWTNFEGNNAFGYPYPNDYHGWYFGYFGFLPGTLPSREARRCTAEWY